MESWSNDGLKYLQETKQIASPETGLPGYLTQIKDQIENSPDTIPYLPPEIKRDGQGNKSLLGWLNQLGNDIRDSKIGAAIKKILDSNPKLGIKNKDGEIVLEAIDFPTIMREYSLSPVLVHQGYVSLQPDGPNPTDKFSRNGIIGNEDPNSPTYLKTAGAKVHPNSKPLSGGKDVCSVCLYVDANKMTQDRSFFTDPEGVTLTPLSRELGHSYLTLGGIPAKAVIGISTNEQSPILLVNN